MSDILVKGMEMPQNCDKCRFQSAFKLYCDAMPDNFCGNTDDIERPDWCPLVEIPTPHGRLGDLDKLIDSCKQYMNMLDPESKEYTKIFALKCYLVAVAEEAVIEAEGETE